MQIIAIMETYLVIFYVVDFSIFAAKIQIIFCQKMCSY